MHEAHQPHPRNLKDDLRHLLDLPRLLADFMKSVNSLSIEPRSEAHGHALGFECCIRGVV